MTSRHDLSSVILLWWVLFNHIGRGLHDSWELLFEPRVVAVPPYVALDLVRILFLLTLGPLLEIRVEQETWRRSPPQQQCSVDSRSALNLYSSKVTPAYRYAQAPLLTCFQGDRLYIGTATGNIHIYDLNDGTDASAFAFSRPRILTNVPLCGSISRRSQPNNHTGRDQDWHVQESHRSVRVHQGYKFACRSLRFESLLPLSFVHSSVLVSS